MTNETITSPSGKTLLLRTAKTTTPKESAEAKIVRIQLKKSTRLAETEALLADRNVAAFLKAIAEAEGGGYDFKYGAVKGKRNDRWRFTDLFNTSRTWLRRMDNRSRLVPDHDRYVAEPRWEDGVDRFLSENAGSARCRDTAFFRDCGEN